MERTGMRPLPIVVGAIVLAIALAIGLLGFAQQASAANLKAGSLSTQASSAKKVVKGTITGGKMVSKTFKMPKKGYVTFVVSVPKGTGTTAVRIDSGDIRYVSENVVNGQVSGFNGKYTSGRYSFAPNARIRVTLEFTSIGNQKVPYTIAMVNKKPANYESESNNQRSRADSMKAGAAYSGNIIKKDTDWFVFKAPKTGTYRFWGKMALLPTATPSYASMSVFKGAKSVATQNLASGDGYESLGTVALKKGGKAYVKVMPGVSAQAVTDNLPTGISSTLPTGALANLQTGTSTTTPSNATSAALASLLNNLPANQTTNTTDNYTLKVVKVK